MCGLALRAGGRLRGGRGVGAGGHLLLCGPGTVTSWEPEGREAGPGLGGRVWRAWGPAAWRRVATLSFPHERWESGIPDVAPTSCARELSVGGERWRGGTVGAEQSRGVFSPRETHAVFPERLRVSRGRFCTDAQADGGLPREAGGGGCSPARRGAPQGGCGWGGGCSRLLTVFSASSPLAPRPGASSFWFEDICPPGA